MISIIIPTLNEEMYLPILLDSLTKQTNKDFEVIIVDGNSKDHTVQFAKRFKRKLSRLFVYQSDIAGVSRQRNIGSKNAHGDWLLFLDADSILLPYAIDRMYACIKKKKPVLFTTWFRPDSEAIGDAMVTLFFNIIFEGAVLLHRPFTQGTFAAVQRDIFRRAGGYDESLSFGEDYDLTKRICQRGVKLHVLRETLYVYSLRRYRHQRTLQNIQGYIRVIVSVLLMNKTPRFIAGYDMGGHVYSKKIKATQTSSLRKFNKKVRSLWKEFIEL